MFTGMEKEYFERFLEAQFENVNSKLDHQINLQKTANGKIAEHEKEIHEIKLKLASSQGHWSGVNKTVALLLTIIGIVVGAIITWQFH